MKTSDPAYWAAKLADAERRVRVAAKELARRTTPNGHARRTDAYEAAWAELLSAVSGYTSQLQAIPQAERARARHRPVEGVRP